MTSNERFRAIRNALVLIGINLAAVTVLLAIAFWLGDGTDVLWVFLLFAAFLGFIPVVYLLRGNAILIEAIFGKVVHDSGKGRKNIGSSGFGAALGCLWTILDLFSGGGSTTHSEYNGWAVHEIKLGDERFVVSQKQFEAVENGPMTIVYLPRTRHVISVNNT